MTVHLEGMGLQGALLAHRLHMYGVEFTWHDIDAPICAWKASTGAIYPADSTNHGPDRECWKVWKSWYEHGYFDAKHLEKSSGLVFCTQNPPHKGEYDSTEVAGGLRLGLEPSFHFNAQRFVPCMRKQFAEQRLDEAPQGKPLIITHGFGQRLHHTYWGWTRLVELDYPDELQRDGLRPAFYLRPTRFEMAYAYPVAGTKWFYAGSNIIKQRKGKERQLEVQPKYDLWKSRFERFSGGRVKVTAESCFITGWRPAAAEEDTAWVRRKGLVLTLRPLWNSGIRHFPAQWAAVANQLGLVP